MSAYQISYNGLKDLIQQEADLETRKEKLETEPLVEDYQVREFSHFAIEIVTVKNAEEDLEVYVTLFEDGTKRGESWELSFVSVALLFEGSDQFAEMLNHILCRYE